MEKNNLTRKGYILLNILEIYIPAIMFIVLFISFILGIFFRYVLRNPQSWTFEISSISYLAVGVLSWGIAHRTDENVVFDMLYEKVSSKTQCGLRIFINLVVTIVSGVLIYPSIKYLLGMIGLTAQVINIPRFIIFIPFTISFTVATLRSCFRMLLDLKSFVSKDYVQKYGKTGGDME